MANLAAILGGASFGHGEIPFREPTNKSMNSHAEQCCPVENAWHRRHSFSLTA